MKSSRYIAAIILIAGFAVGCAQLQKLQADPRTQAAESIAGKILFQAAATYATGGTIDAAWAVPIALNSISDVVKATTSNAQAAALVQSTVTAFAADPKLKTVGQDLAKAFIAANPITPEQKQAVVVALSTGASNGVQQAVTGP